MRLASLEEEEGEAEEEEEEEEEALESAAAGGEEEEAETATAAFFLSIPAAVSRFGEAAADGAVAERFISRLVGSLAGPAKGEKSSQR